MFISAGNFSGIYIFMAKNQMKKSLYV